MNPDRRSWLAAHPALVALLLFAGSLAVYRGAGNYFVTGDNAPAELLPVNLFKGQGFDFSEAVDPLEPLPYWFAEHDGRVLSFYPIVPGLLNVPVFALARARGVDLEAQRFRLSKWTACILVAGSVAAIWFALLAICDSALIALLTTLLYAFGTSAWSTGAQAIWQHGPSLLFLSSALALLLRPQGRFSTPLAGFLLGMAVFNRPVNLVFALPAAAHVVIEHRRSPRALAAFFALAAIPAAAMSLYSIHYWGDFWALGQGHRLAEVHGPHHNGFSSPLLPGLAGVLFSPGRGLFVYSPVLLAAFPFLFGELKRLNRNAVLAWFCLGAIADLFLFAKWNIWWGGWSFGPRMLTELLPALALCLGLSLSWIVRLPRRPRFAAAALLAPLAAWSIWANFLGARYYGREWDAEKDVDHHPDRLWDTSDTQLHRLQAKFRAELAR